MEASSAGYAGSTVSRTRDREIAGIAIVALLICMPVGYLNGNVTSGDVIGLVAMLIVSFSVLAAVMLWLVPRERAAGRDARAALIVGIVAIVVCVGFWTGLPIAVGAGAVALGLAAPAGASGTAPTQAKVGLGLGAFALLATFVLMLVG